MRDVLVDALSKSDDDLCHFTYWLQVVVNNLFVPATYPVVCRISSHHRRETTVNDVGFIFFDSSMAIERPYAVFSTVTNQHFLIACAGEEQRKRAILAGNTDSSRLRYEYRCIAIQL